MPRRREVPKRDILPDQNLAVRKCQIYQCADDRWKKSVAERILYGAFDQVVKEWKRCAGSLLSQLTIFVHWWKLKSPCRRELSGAC